MPNICPVAACGGKGFSRRSGLKRHWAEYHSEMVIIFPCPSCPFYSTRKEDTIRHGRKTHNFTFTIIEYTTTVNSKYIPPGDVTCPLGELVLLEFNDAKSSTNFTSEVPANSSPALPSTACTVPLESEENKQLNSSTSVISEEVPAESSPALPTTTCTVPLESEVRQSFDASTSFTSEQVPAGSSPDAEALHTSAANPMETEMTAACTVPLEAEARHSFKFFMENFFPVGCSDSSDCTAADILGSLRETEYILEHFRNRRENMLELYHRSIWGWGDQSKESV